MNHLNKEMLHEWSPEALDEYQENLQEQMAQLAIYYSQVLEERTDRWKKTHGEMNG